MKKLCIKKQRFLLLFSLLVIISTILVYSLVLFSIPQNLSLISGEQSYLLNFKIPFNFIAQTDRDGTLLLNGSVAGAENEVLSLTSPISVTTLKDGKTNLKLKLFGIIPLRTVAIDVYPNLKVIPCGNAVGVKIYTKGVLIIATSDVEGMDGKNYSPAKQHGLKAGDLIVEINNQTVKDTKHLIEFISESGGREISLKYKRGNTYNTIKFKPILAKEDNQFHIGLWVRDGTAGIGTLTCLIPESNMFGALGHGITDIDTGSLLPIGKGEMLKCKILSVNKGIKGKPGELKGVFLEDMNKFGNIFDNCEFGIYGKISEDARHIFASEPIPISLRSQVKEGPAQILSNIQDDRVEAFDIEICKITQQSIKSSKGMTIRVTDPRLLNTTGGIVQGMSGSPIIQNGRLVGAVTHVLINKPEYGYGIFIEWMIQEMYRVEGNLITNNDT